MIGNPIAHSKSPAIHAMFAAQTGEPVEYGRLLAPIDGFSAAVDAFRADGGRGLNVTLPFKLQAFDYAATLSERAAIAGAVNTLAFEGDAAYGDNTDGAGLVADLAGRLGFPLAGSAVLLLGAGGAARGVIGPLLAAGASRVVIANRTAARATDLLAAMPEALRERLSACGFDEVGRAGAGCELVINATASGLAGEAPAIPPETLARAALAYDLFYAAAPTAFMRAAAAAGCTRVSDGLGMLVEQAAESFALWRGVRPLTAPVFEALRAGLAPAPGN